MAQSSASVAHSIYRIVFRGGSPQRIQYSDRRLIVSVLATTGLAVVSQTLFFDSSIIETGLALFTLLTGTYLLAALLTRKSPRGRLRQTPLAIFLILAAAQVLLVLAAPLAATAPSTKPMVVTIVVLGVLVGAQRSLRYALAGPALTAWTYTLLYAFALVTFYVTMNFLLAIVFR
ncbi:MAG: hypothetical protein P8Y69_00085 [Gammaproteobacteria bacterium]